MARVAVEPIFASRTIDMFGELEQNLSRHASRLQGLLALNLASDSRVELENQIAATQGHRARIAIARYCIGDTSVVSAITDEAHATLATAYHSLQWGVHNPYYMASLAGNQLRAGVISKRDTQELRQTVNTIATLCMPRVLTSSNHRRGLVTSARHLIQSRNRTVAINAVRDGSV